MAEPPDENEFGKRIAQFREARGLSQKELARKIDRQSTLISKYETGRQPPKEPKDYVKLIVALGVTPAELFGMPADSGKIENPGIAIRMHQLFEQVEPDQLSDFFAIFDAVLALMKRAAGDGDAAGAADPSRRRRTKKTGGP